MAIELLSVALFVLAGLFVIVRGTKRLIQGPRTRDIPARGEKWHFVAGDGPYPPVKILEADRRTVRYAFANGGESIIGQDSFRRMYRPVP